MPSNPTEADRMMAVLTATEGGSWNAVNMYDVCIHTVGLIQWCDRYYLVTDLYGKVYERDPTLLAPLREVLEFSNADLRMSVRGKYRFVYKDSRGKVDSPQEQKRLYLWNSTGHKGSWDAESRAHAKNWAAAAATVFEHPDAIEVQRNYTISKLLGGAFVLPFARSIIRDAPDNDLGRAFTAAYMSYAGNNPTWANKYLQAAIGSSKAERYSQDWLVDVLRMLTFGPKVYIYPHRYKAIRPVLERLYGIDIPDLPADLKTELSLTPSEIQNLLLDLGHDLGPHGVDGRIGPKTMEAVREFQRAHGMDDDGLIGEDTIDALKRALEAVNEVKVKEGAAVIGPELRAQITAAVAESVRIGLNDYFSKRRPMDHG